jgi:hypothetical protein
MLKIAKANRSALSGLAKYNHGGRKPSGRKWKSVN